MSTTSERIRMSARDDGGPAFPCERERGERLDSAPGMTLRDYFAAKAMHAILNAAMQQWAASNPEDAVPLAKAAYFMADAMLAERAK